MKRTTLGELNQFASHLHSLFRAGRDADALTTLRATAHQQARFDLGLGAGAVLAERDAWREAITVWTALIEPASDLGRRDVLGAIYSNLAAAYRDLGDFALARSFQQQALHWQDDFGADDLLHLANDALAADRFPLALSLLESAAASIDDDHPLQAELIATRGVLALRERNPRLAVRCLIAAYRRHLAQGDWNGVGRDLLNGAVAAEQMGRLAVAQRLLRESQRAFHQAGQPHWTAEARVRRSRLRHLRSISATHAAWN